MQGNTLEKMANSTIDRPWGIGGSDIGAIVGLSPYKSAVDVWLEKVGRASLGSQKGINLRYGQHLESFVAREYERVTGHETVLFPKTLRHKNHPHFFAHVDRLVRKGGIHVTTTDGSIFTDTLLECKTANTFTKEQWGEEWTDQVPPSYIAQCAWYMALTDCTEAHLAVLLGNSDFRVYRILKDKELETALLNAANSFWENNVIPQIPPEPLTKKEVAKLYPTEIRGLDIEADEELLVQIGLLKRTLRAIKRLERKSVEISDKLAIKMKDAERIYSQGRILATWRSSKPHRRLDMSRLRRERPEILSEYGVDGAVSRRLVLTGERDDA